MPTTHQNLLGGDGADHAAEVAKVGRAHLPHMEQGVHAQRREPLQEQPLRHFASDERRHFGQQLNKNKRNKLESCGKTCCILVSSANKN